MFQGKKHDNPDEEKPKPQSSAQHKHSAGKKEADRDKMIKIKDSEYQRLMKEGAEYKDKYVRMYAELENIRKRFDRDKFEFLKYANEGLIAEFLNILDDLERSVEAASARHQDYDAFLKGIEMIMVRIYNMLKKNDVKPIESVGLTSFFFNIL